jgi:signal transduction histidine kinase
VLAGIADDYFFIPPLHTLHLNAAVIVRLLVFLTVALLTSYLTSQRQRLLIAERHARAQAEDANRIKDRFLAVTSHELRTPLSAIVMWTDVLAHQQPADASSEDASRAEGIDIIRTNAMALSRMIDELLDTSRIAAGKLRLDARSLHLADPVNAAIDALRPAARAKEIELLASITRTDERINADPVRLQQIVTNLLTNALKFTPEGGTIETTLRYCDSHAELSIQDDGCGIDPEDLPHIFERFWQANVLKDRKQSEGLGLGLAITRDLVLLHNGTIRAESLGVGHGVTFTVTLPLHKPNREPWAVQGERAPKASTQSCSGGAMQQG